MFGDDDSSLRRDSQEASPFLCLAVGSHGRRLSGTPSSEDRSPLGAAETSASGGVALGPGPQMPAAPNLHKVAVSSPQASSEQPSNDSQASNDHHAEDVDEEQFSRCNRSCVTKSLLFVIIAAIIVVVVVDSFTTMRLMDWYETFLVWLRE